MLKPKSVSWRDWARSRTIKFNSTVASLSAAVVPVVLAVDEGDLIALGLSPKYVVVGVMVITISAALYNNRLRGKTSHPLQGRACLNKNDLL